MKKTKGFLTLISFLFLMAIFHASQAQASCDVYLSWLPSAGAAGYKIYYGNTSGSPYSNVINVGKPGENPQTGRIHWSVPGLSCDKTYYLASRAFDSSGSESAFSREIKFGEGALPAPASPRLFLIK
jgi:hypothetical protein